MSIWDDISNGIGSAANTTGSALSGLGNGISSAIGTGLNGLGGIVSGNPNGNTPFEQMSPLRRFTIGLGGQNAINIANQPALAQLGSDLATGRIDQGQYLKGLAQYSPDAYNKMQLAHMQNQAPAALQNFDKVQALKESGDIALENGDRATAQQLYSKANNLMAIIRGGAYGVDTFQLPQATPAPTGSAPLPPTNQSVQPESFVSSSEPAPTNVNNPIAAQIAANAALKKGAESDAANISDLKYKPDIARVTEEEKQKAERAGIEPKELETKRTQAYVAALEAAPLLKNLKDLNEGTIDSPYAGAFQPILKMTDSEKAKNLDLMKQARLELAAPLAKQLGVNPTDKDFQASLDRIFDISSGKDSRAAQIKALTERVMSKPGLYSSSATPNSAPTDLPQGTRSNADGTLTLPNGQIIRKKQ